MKKRSPLVGVQLGGKEEGKKQATSIVYQTFHYKKTPKIGVFYPPIFGCLNRTSVLYLD
jgi:hypothetical protein